MNTRVRAALGASVAACLVAASLVAEAQADPPPPTFNAGSSDLGDPLVPGLGNGGYDVRHYGIGLTYQPATGLLTGKTTVTATATADLSRFDLDFVLPTRSVTVNGETATFALHKNPDFSASGELVVTPKHGVPAGSRMVVVVTYRGRPGHVLVDGYSEWSATPTGSTVWNEPDAAAEWWYPGNDYPSDKATYDVKVTTPRAYTAVSNGRLLSRRVRDGRATAHWRSTDPMASYLTELTIGRYHVTRGRVLGRIPNYTAYEAGEGILERRARHDVGQTPRVLAFLQRTWGRYPLAAAGGVVVGVPYASSLETQTRPVYEYGLWQNAVDNLWVVVHENSHQWFGDSVTMSRWRHIWLAEGFATYSEWLWSQAQREGTSEQLFLSTYQQRSVDAGFWSTPLDDPSYPLDISVYQRGAMLLQALRNRVGGATFHRLMLTWLRIHRHRNASTADFEALATRVSGQDLTSFFAAWVDATTIPAPTGANGFPPAAQATLRRGWVAAPSTGRPIAHADAALAALARRSGSGG